MSKKGSQYTCPPKTLPHPADLQPLREAGRIIKDYISREHSNMIRHAKNR